MAESGEIEFLGTKNRLGLPEIIRCFVRWHVSRCETGRFASRNVPSWKAKCGVLHGKKWRFWAVLWCFMGRFCCTISLIGLISLIRPIGYDCTPVACVFAAKWFLFSNTRKMEGFGIAFLTFVATVRLATAFGQICIGPPDGGWRQPCVY